MSTLSFACIFILSAIETTNYRTRADANDVEIFGRCPEVL